MKVEDINIREVFTSNSKKTIEINIATRNFAVNSSAPETSESCKLVCFPYTLATKAFLGIKKYFVGSSFDSVEEVDALLKELDPTNDFNGIGGNLAFAISSALLKALAKSEGVQVHEYLGKRKSDMPAPLGQVLVTPKIGFSEMMLFPARERDFSKSASLLNSVRNDFVQPANLHSALAELSKFTTPLSLRIGVRLAVPYDTKDGRYVYPKEKMNAQEHMLFIQEIAKDYPVSYIEDPFYKEDFVLPATLTHRLPTRIVAGNELYSNDISRLDTGTRIKSTNGIVITPHEAGTITGTINLVEKARKHNMAIVMSCINNVDDNLAAQLAVGLRCDFAKIAFDSNSIAKVNELIRISEAP
ncbi:MAG: hypothetical protein HYT70_02400 [Candidatus Aenigmarchaeota archaeon]|nr:hypothetical protein [Candidatus Aenigmarchaeota archaeon]